ncbi:MAG: hypothetical protein IH823_07820 [Candidatus Dadabacteria bacterium]|nr:hypothetical protein [Candidatus Dadabacteria bacterium]
MNKFILIISILAAIFISACTQVPEINNFEECIAAGNPAMESYPRQCRDSEGNLLHSISIQKDITDRIKNQKERDQLALDLSYRVNELSCLQRISNLIEEEMEISELFLRIIKIVPSGLRYPEKAWARIIFDDLDYIINEENNNEDFLAGSDIGVSGKLRGVLKIGYYDETEILSEEIDMIHNITHRIGMLIERNELRENLIQQEKLKAIQKLAAAVAHEFNQPLQVLQLLCPIHQKPSNLQIACCPLHIVYWLMD